VDPGLYQADGDFLLKSMGIFSMRFWGCFDSVADSLLGPEWRGGTEPNLALNPANFFCYIFQTKL
jgi:hypothetical protein